ncbi:MAG: TM2 domain-containing protein [Firmicutes bacterium]|nr:TM2 domain-containing protein [Bacillota bacterium]
MRCGRAVCRDCTREVGGKVYCSGCAVGASVVQASTKSKLAAGLLAILLGGLGVHRFYLGHILLGIVYLLFCWTGIPSIIGIVEGVIYLTMSDEEFARRYGQPGPGGMSVA